MSGVGSISCARGSVNKFRGALVGALIGDCLGSHYEGISCVIPWGEVVDYTGNRIKTNTEQLRYTDDSAMTRAVCRSLIQKQGYDNRAMAKEFVEEYFRDSERGYGAAVGTVFQRLKDEQPEDVTQPARLQFEGQGSYGNGAAMRISPLALFGLNSSEVQEYARENALITHAHIKGVNGAIIQAEAVLKALGLQQRNLDQDKFVDDLVKLAQRLEQEHDTGPEETDDNSQERIDSSKYSSRPEKDFSYADKIKEMKKLLTRGKDLTQETVVETFGNGIRAEQAVPAAIFAFLYKGCVSFEESINYAISLGGDTDTIASMTGAISGAFWGIDNIPELWRKMCEGVEDALEFANKIYELREKSREK